MDQLERFRVMHATYHKHGWQLARVLMRVETLAELAPSSIAARSEALSFENAPVQESSLDAMWFKRASSGEREAWELRLVADTPYALFELFEADEAEEDREDVRREMEAKMRETMKAE